MSKDLVKQEEGGLQPQNPIVQLIGVALEKGQSVTELVQIYREEREDQRLVAFNTAMQRCQEKMKRIAADMENPQTRSRYASYAAIDRVIRPIYTGEGLSLSFGDAEQTEPGMLHVICYVALGGYTRTYHKYMPIVTTGAQGKAVMTATHAHGSADAYAKRYLVKDIFNLAIGEDDDDGNGGLTDEQKNLVRDIENAATPEELETIYKAAFKVAFNNGSNAAMKAYVDAKDSRKEELANEPANA